LKTNLELAAVFQGVEALGEGLYLQSQRTVENQQLLNNCHHVKTTQ